VVGDRGFTGGVGEGAGLEQRVAVERGCRLRDFGDVGRPRHQLVVDEDRRDLGRLVGIGGGEDQPHTLSRMGGGSSRTAICSSRICAIPCSPSASSSSSSLRLNGRPSAVPCTSTNRTSLVITRFLPTS